MPEDNRPTIAQPWCLNHQEIIEQLRHDVYGNGRPGLKAEVHEMRVTMRVSLMWLKGIAVLVALPQLWKLLELLTTHE